MDIKKRLREFKKKKAAVDSTLARIETYKQFLQNENIELYTYVNCPDNFGMPKAPFSRGGSMVESAIFEKELDRELVQEWIKEDESRIFLLKLEVEQIEIAMKSLTAEQRFVIECKYFEGWIWRTIESAFNERFQKSREYISDRGLKFKNNEAIDILQEILTPFYEQFSIL